MKISLGGVIAAILALGLLAVVVAINFLHPPRQSQGEMEAQALAAERAFLETQYPTAVISGPFEYKEDPVQSLGAGCLRDPPAISAGRGGGRSPPDYMLEHAYIVATDKVGLTVLVCRDVTSPAGFKAIEKWPKP